MTKTDAPFSDYLKMARALWAVISCNVRLFGHLWLVKRKHIILGTYRTIEGEPTMEFLEDFTEKQTRYAAELFQRLCVSLGIVVTFEHPGVDLSGNTLPFVATANHQTTADIVVLYALLARLGWTHTYWTMKKPLKKTPYGWAGSETFAAFLGRDGDEADIRATHVTGAAAKRNRAAVAIFPEGTRRTEALMEDSPHEELLKFRLGGTLALLEEIPNGFLLWVTFFWGGETRELNIRTIADMRGMIGRTLYIGAKVVTRAELGLDPVIGLKRLWRETDAELVALRKQQAATQTTHAQV